jgi:hypothetical protein
MEMADALIGFSGFVGSTLLRQKSFDGLYRSTNIADIDGNRYDTLVCAGAPAQKWLADRLKTVRCNTFVLISTVDVFNAPIEVAENDIVDEDGLHPYGLNRRKLEIFVENHFLNRLIVRLPGLVGPGLRKNVIFDFLNSNNLHLVESRGIFQFYPVVNLWYDIRTAINAGLKLVHLTAAPISVADVSLHGFGKRFSQELSGTPALYDMRTRHADIFGAVGCYQYTVQETTQSIRYYAQSEPRLEKPAAGGVV